jgi:hypothetical protein
MWKMTASSLESINKPITKRKIHPEMEDIQSGEELLVFKPDAEEGDDDEGDVIIIRK